MANAGEAARREQDARWRANAPRRNAREAWFGWIMFWLFIGIPGFFVLAAILGPMVASIGLVPFLLLILIMLTVH